MVTLPPKTNYYPQRFALVPNTQHNSQYADEFLEDPISTQRGAVSTGAYRTIAGKNNSTLDVKLVKVKK